MAFSLNLQLKEGRSIEVDRKSWSSVGARPIINAEAQDAVAAARSRHQGQVHQVRTPSARASGVWMAKIKPSRRADAAPEKDAWPATILTGLQGAIKSLITPLTDRFQPVLLCSVRPESAPSAQLNPYSVAHVWLGPGANAVRFRSAG